MIISFYKRLTRSPGIRNTSVWVLPYIWRMGWVRITKFSMNVSNIMLLNAAKCQCYSFLRFWVIKTKSTGGRGKFIPISLPPLRLGLKDLSMFNKLGTENTAFLFLWKSPNCLMAKSHYKNTEPFTSRVACKLHSNSKLENTK